MMNWRKVFVSSTDVEFEFRFNSDPHFPHERYQLVVGYEADRSWKERIPAPQQKQVEESRRLHFAFSIQIKHLSSQSPTSHLTIGPRSAASCLIIKTRFEVHHNSSREEEKQLSVDTSPVPLHWNRRVIKKCRQEAHKRSKSQHEDSTASCDPDCRQCKRRQARLAQVTMPTTTTTTTTATITTTAAAVVVVKYVELDYEMPR
ncbi:hypothetical protein TSMEX_000541 [Taenia solium]|eukprot:TsM_000181800 transcript=TsM_000181800 gene=TsM_000181800